MCFTLRDIKKGLKEKFLQNPEMKAYLLSYKEHEIIESSPFDRIWGIGFSAEKALGNKHRWGQNLLGKMLNEIAEDIG